MFTDLVGSTELLGRLGPVAGEELRRAHFRILRTAVASHRGREVKNVGDGVMVAFASPTDAVACAVAIQRGAEVHNRGREGALCIRIGVNTGEATADDDGDLFGMPIVIAKRLCDDAEGGQILVTEIVRMLGAGAGTLFLPASERKLKGVPEAVVCHAVSWSAADGEGLPPLPRSLRLEDPSPFVGRDGELAHLVDEWKQAREGQGRTKLVAGEPGIGKTRLLSELALVAREQGALVLYGHCDEEPLAPYQPFVEAIGQWVGAAPDHVLDAQRATLGPLARIVPKLVAHVPSSSASDDNEASRLVLFESMTGLLTAISADQPVLLLLDDLHWADKPTLLLFRHLAEHAPETAVLVVGTYRDTDLTRTHPLADVLADLRRSRSADRVSLEGLGLEGVADFLAGAAGHDLDDRALQLASAIHAETSGNPFFVEEIWRDLAESGRIYRQGGRWVSDAATIEDLAIPEGVREVVGRRLSHLGSAANSVLTAASVLGRTFDAALLSDLGEVTDDEVETTISEALSARLVVEAAGRLHYSFSHALVRQTLYEEIPAIRRVRLHERAAQALESAGGGQQRLGEVAHHYSEAAAGGGVAAAKAVEYGRRAGEHALSLLAFEEAAGHFERALLALELASGEAADEERFELLLALGDAHYRATEISSGREVFLRAADLARAHLTPLHLGRAAIALGGLPSGVSLGTAGAPDLNSGSLVREALAAFGHDAEGQFTPVRARLAASLVGEPELFPQSGDSGLLFDLDDLIRQLEHVGDGPSLIYARLARRAQLAPFDLDGRAEQTAAIVELARRTGDVGFQLFGLHLQLVEQEARGDREEAEAIVDEHDHLAARHRYRHHEVLTLQDRAMLALVDGDYQSAEDLALRALAEGEAAGLPSTAQAFAVQLGVLALERDGVEGAVETAATMDDEFRHGAWDAALALFAAEAGDHDEARRRLEAFDYGFGAAGANVLRDVSLVLLGDVAATVGARERAAMLYDALSPWRGLAIDVSGLHWYGPADRVLGRLAHVLQRFEEAEAHFEEALRLCHKMRARPRLAITSTDYADLLLARGAPGDATRVSSLLEIASTIAESCGMNPLRQRLARLR